MDSLQKCIMQVHVLLEIVGFGWAKFDLKEKKDNIIRVFKLMNLVGGIMCLYGAL